MILLSFAHAACPDLGEVLSMAETELQDVHLDAVHADLERAHEALGCGTVARPEQVARLWLIEGVTALVENDPTTAADALQAVARIDAGQFEDRYGPRVLAAWQEAIEAVPGRARLVIDPIPPGSQRWIDGRPVRGDEPTTSGLHVVQVTDATGRVRHGEVIFLDAGQHYTIETDFQDSITTPPPPPPPRKRRIRAPGWAVVAGLAAASAVGTGVYASTQNQGYRKATRYDELDRVRARQVGAATATYGLGGVAAAAGVLFLARQF